MPFIRFKANIALFVPIGAQIGTIEQGLLSDEASKATMLYSVPSSEKTKAVQYLIDHIPDETMRDVKNAMDQNGKD